MENGAMYMIEKSPLEDPIKYSLDSFYDDATIFITGATGFIGKLLVRKLLSTFPKIKMIYILVRPKKQMSSEQRIQEYFSQQIFSGLSYDCADFTSKIIGVPGDVSKPKLGLSNADVTILKQEVQIVFNIAANVRLTENLKISLKTNTRSVLELLSICKDMDRLKCILHVSTAVSHTHIGNTLLKEEFISSEVKYENILKLVELLDSDTLERITPGLVSPWVGVYIFSKYLGEHICWESDLPVGVFRPGAVLSTYQDPVAGWTDNLYAAIGVSALVQSGIIRCFKGHPEYHSLVVPADSCVNAMIAAAVEIHETSKTSSKTLVYNYCSGDNPLTWRQYFAKHQLGMEYPLKDAMWAPMLFFCSTDLGYKVATLVLHLLPAYVCDLFLLMTGQTPRYTKMYKKLQSPFLDVLTPLFNNDWRLEHKNIGKLWNRIALNDRQRLPFNMPDFSWDEYFKQYIRGLGKYMKNQKDEDLPSARRKYFLFRLINKLIVVLLIGAILMLIWKVIL